jgi:hypothetical protein
MTTITEPRKDSDIICADSPIFEERTKEKRMAPINNKI